MSEVPSSPKVSAAEVADPSHRPSGKLAALTLFAAATNVVPIPFLPDRLIAQIRGALAHDIASRHGLSLTSEARKILAQAESSAHPALRRAAEVITRQLLRRLRSFSLASGALRSAEVYAFGILFEAFLQNHRPEGTVRIHDDEAQRIRQAIDAALLRAFSPTVRPALTTVAGTHEDLRDEFTRWVDTLLLTGAALPDYVERRLLAAFEEVVREGATGSA